MKKFVSMAMVAAMTTSMVPATAFAGVGEVEATAKIVDAWTMTKDFDGNVVNDDKDSVPELQIKITDTNYKKTTVDNEDYYAEITVSLDNAELDDSFTTDNIKVILGSEAKDEMAADQNSSSAAVTTAQKKVNAVKKELYGEAMDPAAPEEGSLAKALEDAEAELETALSTVAPPADLDEQIAADADVIAAKATQTAAAEAVTEAEEAVEEADIAVATAAAAVTTATTAITTYKYDMGTDDPADDKTVEQLTTAVNDAKGDYDDAKEALAGGTGSQDDVDAAALALGTAKDNLAAAEAEMAELEAAKTEAETALETAEGAVEEVADALEAAKDAKTEADDAVTEAEGVARAKILAASDDATVVAAAEAVEAAQAAVREAEGRLETAETELEEAKAKDDANTEAAGSTDFKVVPVEGFSKAKAAMKDVDEFTFGIKGKLHTGDVISIDLATVMDKTSVGRQATLDVESDDLNLDVADLVYVGVEDYGITATTKKLATVAEDEEATLEKDLKIESVVGNFQVDQTIELKLNNGFEFKKAWKGFTGDDYTVVDVDGNKAIIEVDTETDEIVIKANELTIVADGAKSGDVATITVKATASDKDGNKVDKAFKATTKVEVMKVVDYTVIMSVEEDEDLPLIYSGTNVNNAGITDDSDHMSLEVTIEESFPGAWSMRKGFNLELPDGVYVTDVNVVEAENFYQTVGGVQDAGDWDEAFKNAYQDGDHKNFEFDKRVFDDVNTELADDEASVTFELELVADPTFAGDVTLKFTGDLVDEQEVTIAKFMPIAVVEAEQNDMKIDYRYTEIPTEIKVTETAAGLWKEGSQFWMAIDKDVIEFEEDATFEATNGMEIDDLEDNDVKFKSLDEGVPAIGFEVEEESDEAATVTISDMSLFMNRNIPAGPYDLIAKNTAAEAYLVQKLFAEDTHTSWTAHDAADCDDECFIADVEDFSDVVKEAFINVVTAGREQDDASFTTKVVVPVGESYIVSGENTVELDVPAYVSAAGYTMLPVRAVANALGINNNNVIWNGETKTVTILYGQRIITMVAGQKVINVNGSAIPASAAVEIVDGRTFLPMRDLATALGVTDITWDAATKTATLNGGVVAE